MMSVAALGVVTVTWALVGYSLAFDEGNGFIGGFDNAFLRASGSRRAPGTHDPAPALHGLPGDLLHHHRGADLGRGRRAHALRRRSSSSSSLWACSSTRRSRTGSGAAAGCRRTARSTSPAASRSRWPRASRRSRPRSSSARARTTAARRCCRTTASTCCSAPGCCGSAGSASTAAAASRPGSERARVHEHAARARRTLSSGSCSTCCAAARSTAIGAATAIVVGCVGDHARRRATSARCGRWRSARSARSRATRSSCGGRGRGSTRRSTCSPRTGSAGFIGILFIGLFAAEVLERRLATALLFGDARQLGGPGAGGARRPAYAFAATFVLLRLIGLVMPLRATERRRARDRRRRSTARRPTCRATARS